VHCRFSLTVFDNQNLQEVWNAGSSIVNLKIAKGAVYFHFNPKLCLSNINQLVAGSGLPNKTNDISLVSNGDQVACKYTVVYYYCRWLTSTIAIDLSFFSVSLVLSNSVCVSLFLCI